MIRDCFRPKEYFDSFIQKKNDDIVFDIDTLHSGEVLPECIYLAHFLVFQDELCKLIAMYSRGDSIESLKSEYSYLYNTWKDIDNPTWIQKAYTDNLWFISLGILLNADNEIFKCIRSKLDEYSIDDWLFNFLLNQDKNKNQSTQGELICEKRYRTLQKAIMEKSIEFMCIYLNREFYKNFISDESCEPHKNPLPAYFGYWSLEAGAISKIMGFDDNNLKMQQFYPYDLVHYEQ